MNKNSIYTCSRNAIIMLLVALVSACQSSKKLTIEKTNQANALFNAGNYTEAFNAYLAIDSVALLSDTIARRNAIISAYNTHNYKYATSHAIFAFNNDKELLTAVEKSFCALGMTEKANVLILNYESIFTAEYGEKAIANRLAAYHNERESRQLVNYYSKIDNDSLRVACFDNYFKFTSSSMSDDEKLNACKEILQLAPKQETALRFMAINQYKTAEAKYNAAMAEYNKKKNATTYAYLRRDLKRISATYRECKAKFETLRTINPENKDYIKYLININLRLDNNAQAKELEKQL
ncbi:MAG: hypothetical protein K6G73_05230 [Marinilabiliaceae bacterium]|nr:hypothetical protein [Marinilabiliaceae bacterium]